jgi:hypothetical protein
MAQQPHPCGVIFQWRNTMNSIQIEIAKRVGCSQATVSRALGVNPYTATAGVLPTGGIQRVSNVNYPKLSFTRNPSATDITYTVEGSPDLSGSNWSTISTFSNGTWSPSSNVMETSGTTTVWDTTPINSAPRRFMRLKVIH